MTIRLPRLSANLPIVDGDRPNFAFSRDWDEAMGSIETALNAILDLPGIQSALAGLDTATQAAQTAANDAATAAAAAQTAADNAQQATADTAFEQALVNSYIVPASVLSADPTTITIASHTRYYADGTSVWVNGGTAPATAAGDVDYVSYVDALHEGGAVSYIVSTTQPTQVGAVHVVGAVTIPAAGTQAGGSGPRRPGEVEP